MDRENHLMKELRITITNEQAMLVEGLADKIEAGKKAGIELVVEIARQRLEGGHYDLTSIAAPKLYPSVPDSAQTQTTPPVSSRWLDKEETAASSGPPDVPANLLHPLSATGESVDCEGRRIPAPPPWEDPLPKIHSRFPIYNPTGLNQERYDQLSETDKMCLSCAAFYFDVAEQGVRIRADVPCQQRDHNSGAWMDIQPARIADWENQLLLWFLGDGPELFQKFRFPEQCDKHSDITSNS